MGEACRCSRANRARQRGSCGACARHAAAAPVPCACAAQGRENRSGGARARPRRQAIGGARAQGPVDEAKSSVDGDMRTGARFKCMLSARIQGAELGVKICTAELSAMYTGVEVPATSTPPRISCTARPGTSAPRSVASRRVTSAPGLMAPTPGSKDESKSSREPNVNFL